MSVLLSNKKYNLAVSFVFALAILFFSLSNVFNDDNFIYAIGEIHTYNKNLFPNNLPDILQIFYLPLS